MKTLLTGIFLLLMAGCSLTREVPPPVTYHLQTDGVSPKTMHETCTKKVVKVALVSTPKWLKGTEILYSDTHGRMYRYTRARWQIPPADQLQQITENALADSGVFRAVVPYRSLAKYDWALEVRLEAMTQRIADDGSAETDLRLYAVLVERYTRHVLAEKRFDYRARQEKGDAESAVAAWSEAAGKFETDLPAWLENVCKTVPAKDRSDVDL